MLINILCLIIGIAATLVWIKVVKAKTPINYQKFAKDKFWLIFTSATIVTVAYLYFYLPQVFKWLAVDIWGIPASSLGDDKEIKVLQLTDLGTLGDIYGSLNTLFTSATLAFVVYATLLQRQANADARNAMAEQLQQAKDSTAEQLQQAIDATNDQLQQARDALNAQLKQAEYDTEQQITNTKELALIQLEQAKESTSQQLALAQATHDAQIAESQYAIFSNMFYAFLNQKNEILRRLCICENYEMNPNHLFEHISDAFMDVIPKTFNEKSIFEPGVEDDLHVAFCESIDSFKNRSISTNMVYGYFYTYVTLLKLIGRSALEESDKTFFIAIVSNSMSNDEQMCLLWMASFTIDLRRALAKTNFFDADIDISMIPFLVKNMDLSNFRNSSVILKWEQYLKEQTPA